MSKLRIGIIGIGSFGSRVAMRLLWAGFDDLQVYDTHEQTPRVFTSNFGGLSVGSPKMMAESTDIILTALPSAAEMRDVFFGWEGLATGFAKDGLVVDVGLTDPAETVAMGKELATEGGVQLVDAPAFGTIEDAREGRLTMVVGGDDSAVDRARPVLEKLSKKIIRAGATGSAQAAGAIADYMRAVRLLGASEAIRLGSKYGFEASNLLEVCDALGGADLQQLLQREVATRRFKSGTQLGMLHGNVELAARLAAATGVVTPLLTATRDSLDKAEARLGYSVDQSAVIKWLETLVAERTEQDSELADKTEAVKIETAKIQTT